MKVQVNSLSLMCPINEIPMKVAINEAGIDTITIAAFRKLWQEE